MSLGMFPSGTGNGNLLTWCRWTHRPRVVTDSAPNRTTGVDECVTCSAHQNSLRYATQAKGEGRRAEVPERNSAETRGAVCPL